MKKFLSTVFLVTLVSANILSCVFAMAGRSSDGEGAAGDRALASELVGNILDAYRDYTFDDFSDKVSGDFAPDRLNFINNAENSSLEQDIIDITFTLNTVNAYDDKIGVSLEWRKKIRDKDTGDLELKKGSADLLFSKDADGWKLNRVSGDNPFL